MKPDGLYPCVSLQCVAFRIAGDWPNWSGPSFDFVSKEAVSTNWSDAGPKFFGAGRWGRVFRRSPSVGGRAYTMGNRDEQDSVWCFDATNGTPVWRHTYPALLNPQYTKVDPARLRPLPMAKYLRSANGVMFFAWMQPTVK
jgi:hypothetical protein